MHVLTTIRRAEYFELAALFLIQAMAMGMWFVPLSTVLQAQGLGHIRPYAYATAGLAAFVSPLIFGALADRHASPVIVLRWLGLAVALTMALASLAIQLGWNACLVLGVIQLHAFCAAPTWSLSTTIVLSRLRDSKREFGPIRSLATIGWAAGCLLVSLLNADTSPWSGYGGAVMWLVVVGFTFFLPVVEPPKFAGRLRLRQRLGLDALSLLKHPNHRVVFVTAALFNIALAAYYPYTPAHLQQLGLRHTTAWMALGQITEMIAMFSLAGLLFRFRMKWVFTAGLAAGLIRYAMCALDGKGWVLAGVSLHGFAFTLFFITAQIYLEERIDAAWRARAQALLTLMMNGLGNLLGYLGSGWWFNHCAGIGGTRWPLFWAGLTGAVFLVLAYFLIAYRGQGAGSGRAGLVRES